jgi:hypothetical protein
VLCGELASALIGNRWGSGGRRGIHVKPTHLAIQGAALWGVLASEHSPGDGALVEASGPSQCQDLAGRRPANPHCGGRSLKDRAAWGQFLCRRLVGRDVVIYRKSLTLQLHCLARHTPICQGSYSRAALPSEPGTYLGRIRRSLLSTAMAWCGITWPCYLPCLCPGSGPCGGNAGIGDYPGYATYSVLPLDRRQCRDRELTMQGTKNDESRLYRREAEPLSLPET